MSQRPVVVVSNRGGVSFRLGDGGDVVSSRGGGGLAAGLAGVLDSGDTVWMSAAMGDADRAAVARGIDRELGAHLIDIGADQYANYYDRISNETLWFLHHHLFDLAREPAFDSDWYHAWDDYRTVNRIFAEALADSAAPNSVILVQDYHLSLVARFLRELRPDVSTVHFHHTPFAEAPFMDLLPSDVAIELMGGLADFDACGFHSRRWSRAFEECCRRVGVTPPPTFVSPLPIHPDALIATAESDEVAAESRRLQSIVGDRSFLVRVDRIELSKNLIRGFRAFDLMLDQAPHLVGNVTFGAFCYPSRPNVEAYAAYRRDVEAEVERINSKWARDEWTPVLLETDDNYPRSIAALAAADLVLVNPIRDGLNLVAKEAALLNSRNCAVILSRYAGVFDELEEAVRAVNPFDVADTSVAMRELLETTSADRAPTAAALRAAATRRAPSDWLADQLAAASR